MDAAGFLAYDLAPTPIHRAEVFCQTRNLYVKLEGRARHGSIKERAAYYMIRDLLLRGVLTSGVALVESSSGNLGLSLGLFCRQLGVHFLCLVDPTVPAEKLSELTGHGIETTSVELAGHASYRDARIEVASRLDREHGWVWTRQYENPANAQAHLETTGPEIWSQMDGHVDYVVCSVGSGGTVCGIGQFFRHLHPSTVIVGVEPLGSTIFGGSSGSYLSVGAGLSHPPGLVRQFGSVIDCFAQVADADALRACLRFQTAEGILLGVTSGATLAVAHQLAVRHPDRTVLAISPDDGSHYLSILEGVSDDGAPYVTATVQDYREGRAGAEEWDSSCMLSDVPHLPQVGE